MSMLSIVSHIAKPKPDPDPSAYGYNVKFVTAYGPKNVFWVESLEGEGRTKQSFRDECDINRIMKKYQVTGVIDFVAKHPGKYLDCTGASFQAAMDLVVEAEDMFMDLPSSVRARFDNDPAKFLDFCQDVKNVDEMVKMGLAVPKPKAENAGQAAPGAPGGTKSSGT